MDAFAQKDPLIQTVLPTDHSWTNPLAVVNAKWTHLTAQETPLLTTRPTASASATRQQPYLASDKSHLTSSMPVAAPVYALTRLGKVDFYSAALLTTYGTEICALATAP